MSDKKDVQVDLKESLEDSKNELSAYRELLSRESKRVPASSRHLEQRLESIEQELEALSPKVLAYKLRRLADSKVVEDVAHKKTLVVTEHIEDFESNTFKCKTDLEKCLSNESNPWKKALCYALFIRCVVKG